MAEYGQNLEPQGLTAKMFRDKDFGCAARGASRLVDEDLFGEPSRIGQGGAFLNSR
jgi:hypothetical protein